MNQKQFSQNKGLASILLSLAMAVKPAKYPDGKTPKARYGNYRKATKRGAKHKVGVSFRPVKILTISQAQYRHFHVANTEKALREQIKSEKWNEKWISV